MIRTVVCAASEVVRANLADIVAGDARLALVGEATPAELGRIVDALDPDVVVERREPEPASDRTGAELRAPSVTLVDDPRTAWESDALAAERGPHALLTRDAAGEAIVAAIVAVAAGLVAVEPQTLSGTPSARPEAVEGFVERLTPREADVLAELARGVPNKAIAARLGISDHTVKFHVASIFAKLGVASRTEAVARGVRLGLIML